jgi:hypothetical protein
VTARGLKPFLIAAAVIAILALPATVAAQQAPPSGSQEVNEFYLHPSTTQAGGHPDVHLYFRFCSQIPHIIDATNTSPIVITTLEPHGLTDGASIIVRGVRGNVAANTPAGGGSAHVTPALGPNKFELVNSTGSGTYAGGGWVSQATQHGCTENQLNMQLRRFLLQLPPGFLGNPQVVGVCPADQWAVSDNRHTPGEGCPFTSAVGHSNTRTLTLGSFQNPINAPTPLYRVPLNGLEPARLGTDRLFGDPPGPIPIQITLRSSGDYGLNSAVIDLPKNLGGPQAIIHEIETVLCGYAPCFVPLDPQNFDFNFEQPPTVRPLPGARPFFVNPTSCQQAISRLDAWSWSQPNELATATSTDIVNDQSVPSFTPTGCDNVPFDANVSVTPADTAVGIGTAQQVAIDYCNPPPPARPTPSCVNGKDFADDEIWESALRDADVRLPEGMTLSPGGGNGLEGCDFAQFGVNALGKQINDDPPTCPQGAQVGTINVSTPVLPDGALSGKVFFGCDRTSADQPCISTPGRPTPAHPWKLFLYIEGAGLRIKLVGDVDVSETGQIHNVFVQQPEVPFNRLEINLRGGDRSILANPDDCATHEGSAELVGWAEPSDRSFDKRKTSTLSVTPTGCPDPKPFAPKIVSAGSDPEQAGANTTSFITITRDDNEDDIKSLKLSLPVGAVGSIAAVPQCAVAEAQRGNCPEGTKVGTVKTTVGTGTSLLTTAGSLYLAEPSVPGDAATLALVVPAKVGPLDLGQVVVLNRVTLRPDDNGVDATTTDIPNILEGVPLHVRKIEITVDRPGFFLNPTGCDPRPLVATFNSYGGQTSSSTMMLNAKGCENLPFGPKLRLIAGAKGQNKQFQHPPLTAIVTQGAGEANIKNSQVILPDLIRPNAVQFNAPGGLCSDAQFAARACPAPSLAGSARVITPVLPFVLSGPVYVVQEIGSVLPKLYVVLRGRGLEVVLRARNAFLKAIRTINTFDNLPDVPQAYFELKIRGGAGGILNNFYNACGVGKSHRKFDYTFTGQNGKAVKRTAMLEQQGCPTQSGLSASISSSRLKVSKKGVGKLRIFCAGGKACKGKVTVRGKGVKATGKVSIRAKKSKVVKLKFSKKEVRKIRKKKRVKSKAIAKLGSKTIRKSVLVVPAKR